MWGGGGGKNAVLVTENFQLKEWKHDKETLNFILKVHARKKLEQKRQFAPAPLSVGATAPNYVELRMPCMSEIQSILLLMNFECRIQDKKMDKPKC